MPRHKNQLSVIQRDRKRFNALRTEVLRLGVYALSEKGALSNQTIYKYIEPKPVNPKMEAALLEAIKACQADRDQLDEAQKKRVDALLIEATGAVHEPSE